MPSFLRNELRSNNLRDFGLRKGPDHLDAVRKRFQTITDRFASFQAQCLNVHVDFPLLQRIALPVTLGSVRYPGIKIHDTRVIGLLEVLLHAGSNLGGWTVRQIYQTILTSFQLSVTAYGLNQLRYDLRKLKGHGLLERDRSRYAYRLTSKGTQAALLTSDSADRWPTAASTTAPTRFIGSTANSRPPTTRPTKPFRTSSICSRLPDATGSNVGVVLFTIFEVRI
jgi:hypothetical protein